MDRERITISIKKKVLDEIDKVIDGVNVRNRSHAIESLAMQGLGKNESKSAVILLGGDDALKAIPATNNYLVKLKMAGFDKVNIAVGFLGDKVKEKLGDGRDFNLKLEYSDKGEGSGGAIKSFQGQLRKTFIVFNTTKVFETELNFLLNYHKDHKAIATVATNDLETFDGIYIFEPEIFDYIPKDFSMIDENVLPKLIKEGKAIIYPLNTNVN